MGHGWRDYIWRGLIELGEKCDKRGLDKKLRDEPPEAKSSATVTILSSGAVGASIGGTPVDGRRRITTEAQRHGETQFPTLKCGSWRFWVALRFSAAGQAIKNDGLAAEVPGGEKYLSA
jgi:hypothetical protein